MFGSTHPVRVQSGVEDIRYQRSMEDFLSSVNRVNTDSSLTFHFGSTSTDHDVDRGNSYTSLSSSVLRGEATQRGSDQHFTEIHPHANIKTVKSTTLHPANHKSLSSPYAKIASRVGDGIHLLDVWRGQALHFISSERNVFILEAYTVANCILQVKMSINEITMSLNTSPWCMSSARTLSVEFFKRRAVGVIDYDLKAILNLQTVEFSPSRLVRFVLNNSDGVPAIVSSSYSNLMAQGHNKKIADYFIYQKVLPGSQRCCRHDCGRLAMAIHLDVKLQPKGIYCTIHVRELRIDEKVMLYNPLLVAFTPHERNVVISAMDVEEVFGLRYGFCSGLPQDAGPIPLPRKWTPLCKKAQVRQLTNTGKPNAFFYETAKRVLKCATEHLLPCKHFVGADVRHGLTKCMIKTFFSSTGESTLCGFVFTDAPLEEDLPYNWSRGNLQKYWNL